MASDQVDIHAKIYDVLAAYTGLSDTRNEHIAGRVAAAIEADLAARVEAERVACEKAVSVVFDRYHKKSDPISHTMAAGVVMAESSIRALGPTPAFDAAIKAAREDGMEAAVKIAQADERAYQGYVGCNPALIVPRIIAAIRAAKDQPA